MQRTIDAKRRLTFFNHIYEMVAAGITVSEAVKNFETKDRLLKAARHKVSQALGSGYGLCDALGKTGLANNLMLSVLRTGERSGLLEDSLREITGFLERNIHLRGKISEALAVPCFNIVAALVAGLYMSISVLPKVASSLRSLGELPALSRTIFDLAERLAANWYFVVGGLLLLVAAIAVVLRSKPAFLYKVPIIGNVLKYQFLAMLFNSLTVSQRAGTSVIDCLVETQNAFVGFTRSRMAVVIRDMQAGLHVDVAFGKCPALFPKDVVSMVKTARMSGNYDRLFAGIAKMCQDRGLKMAQKTAAIAGPVVIVFVGGLVAVMAMAIYYPIATINVGFN